MCCSLPRFLTNCIRINGVCTCPACLPAAAQARSGLTFAVPPVCVFSPPPLRPTIRSFPTTLHYRATPSFLSGRNLALYCWSDLPPPPTGLGGSASKHVLQHLPNPCCWLSWPLTAVPYFNFSCCCCEAGTNTAVIAACWRGAGLCRSTGGHTHGALRVTHIPVAGPQGSKIE